MTNERINRESKVYNDARITHQSPDAVRSAYKNGDFSKDPQIGNLLSGGFVPGMMPPPGMGPGNDVHSTLGCSFSTNNTSSTNFPEITKTGNANADLMKYAHDNKITPEKAHDILIGKYGEPGNNSTCPSGSSNLTGPQNYGDWNPTGESPSNNSTCSSGSSGLTGPQSYGDWNPTGESPDNNSNCSSCSSGSTCSSGSGGQKTVTIDGHKITLTGNPDKDIETTASILGCNEAEAKQKLQTYAGQPPR